MTLLALYWNFFQIGLFSFGGGYAVLPLIRQRNPPSRQQAGQTLNDLFSGATDGNLVFGTGEHDPSLGHTRVGIHAHRAQRRLASGQGRRDPDIDRLRSEHQAGAGQPEEMCNCGEQSGLGSEGPGTNHRSGCDCRGVPWGQNPGYQ